MKSTILILLASYVIAITARSTDDFTCKAVGIHCDCEDRTKVYYCMLDGTEFKQFLIDTCDGDNKCVALDGGCSKGLDPECDETIFHCGSEGIFPDPYDCKKYHICYKKESSDEEFTVHTGICDAKHGYNVLTTFCSDLVDKCSAAPLTPCTGPTNPAAVTLNPTLYYYCAKEEDLNMYTHRLFKCDNGKTFVGTECQ